MEEGTCSGSRRTRSQVAPDWTLKDCLILVNEIAAVESDCSNALSSFQKWTIISQNCNALDLNRTLNQCRRKWDSLVSDYNQIKQWESKERGSGSHSYWSLSSEKRRKLNLPGNVDNEIFQAISAVMMIQENRTGSEPDSDSDPEEQEDFDVVVDVTAELGSKRSRQRTMMVVMKENPSQKRKTKEEEPRRNIVLEKRAKATHQKKTMEEKKPVVEISTDEEEEEETTMSVEEEVKALEAKLDEKTDMIHAIVGRNLAKGSEKEEDVGIKDKLKFVKQQGDELIACLSEIASTLDRLREVQTE